MTWKVTWKYIDPANDGEYEDDRVFDECSLSEVLVMLSRILPHDHVLSVEIVEYSK